MTAVVVWFKRDLRVEDHAALVAAAAEGPILPVYIVEPDYWRMAYTSARQWQFLKESLLALDQALTLLGQPLWIAVGETEEVFTRMQQRFQFQRMHSHQETGPGWTYQRDQKIKVWAKKNQVEWLQHRQHGVVRGRAQRQHWAKQWAQLMNAKRLPISAELQGVGLPPKPACEVLAALQIGAETLIDAQAGGLVAAEGLLTEFLQTRAEGYRGGISSPLTARTVCSRLSPHLSLGTLSLRTVWQLSQARRDELKAGGGQSRFVASLKSFGSRLHWHCHFMQKLESEPRMEFEALHRGFIGLREFKPEDAERLQRLTEGRLGWPFADACLRCLQQTGWINFRMRAMLVAIASYHLWLDWRLTAPVFARWFTDFEAGIHFSQMQMQAGTTGINANRIYSPLKQSEDQDPAGKFIRLWLPELSQVPTEWIHAPWRMPLNLQQRYACIIGKDYPEAIAEPTQLAREARAKLKQWMLEHDLRPETARVLKAHGSRRRQHRPRKPKKSTAAQTLLDFD
jgi:deoxyribodipyrimidine photo-lyase|tara:strand:- start:8238 stop:9773 length:1536 start_codon:yes stop_codon:yes gene_type:complete